MSAGQTRLLIVEDDQRIAKLLVQFLRFEHFTVDWLQDGEQAVSYIKQTPPDLVILDLMLPKRDGVEVCGAIRPDFDKGILMLTAHEGDIIEVTALNAGVDDFLCKPVRTHVLLARINALLRRQSKPQQSLVQIRDLLIDHNKRTVSRNGENIDLGESEFELLWLLASRAGSIIKRDDLFHLLRGKEYDGLDRSIDMRISKLRKKLAEKSNNFDYIRTIRQLGYVLVKD
ncbi:response regulator transcription factor [Thalassomonas viridans]|uniref:Response regulator transcription factor n=1 Tax=Thalassomonas viridans TaxID=137584 RepID=A0AAE9Z8S4_9GAMM|nr:response regulator transcription factor [Thalassomonas viridans]WDE07388.1 response regulator transcription factor [Thalassomonas viridans]